MKIACLIASLSRNAGGVHDSVRHLCRALQARPDTEVHVFGMEDEHTHEDLATWSPLSPRVFSVQGPREFGYALRLKEKLFDLEADVLLSHGLWMYPTVAAIAWHRQTRRPFIINPHGMLDPWALNQSRWKKRLAGFLHENSALRHAACLRALCPAEAASIRAYGLRNPICVIPNGVELPEENLAPPSPWPGQNATGDKTLLYLGRLHPKKGLPDLLRAWALVQRRPSVSARDWNLVIAGWNQDGHEDDLKSLARQLGLDARVHFPGPQFGAAKADAYRRADALILPSLSEGLPMVVLEAWAHRLPVILTPACHLPEGPAAGAALAAESQPASLADAMETLFAMTAAERARMGDRGHHLVAERFNWTSIGAQMHHVCQWLLGQAGRPDCVLPETRNLHAPRPLEGAPA